MATSAFSQVVSWPPLRFERRKIAWRAAAACEARPGSEKAKIWQQQALRASDKWKELGKARAPSPLGRGLVQEEPGRRFPAAGAGASLGRQAAPKNHIESCIRHETAAPARRESSKTVEFLEIGALQQKLWPRDADRVYPVHCDIQPKPKKQESKRALDALWLSGLLGC